MGLYAENNWLSLRGGLLGGSLIGVLHFRLFFWSVERALKNAGDTGSSWKRIADFFLVGLRSLVTLGLASLWHTVLAGSPLAIGAGVFLGFSVARLKLHQAERQSREVKKNDFRV